MKLFSVKVVTVKKSGFQGADHGDVINQGRDHPAIQKIKRNMQAYLLIPQI